MNDNSMIIVRRCRNWRVIEYLLINSYYDSPICYFPKSLKRAAARWFTEVDGVYFMVAERSGEHAGYVFAHTFGPTLWRAFVKRHLHLVPQIAIALLRKRLKRRMVRPPRAANDAHPSPAPEQASRIGATRVERSFEWSPANSKTAFVDMLYVPSHFRGKGIGPLLLRNISELMAGDGIHDVEAHIDATNHASVRAALKAGWSVMKTTGGDYKAEFHMKEES